MKCREFDWDLWKGMLMFNAGVASAGYEEHGLVDSLGRFIAAAIVVTLWLWAYKTIANAITPRMGTVEGNTPALGIAFRPRLTLLLWRRTLHFGSPP